MKKRIVSVLICLLLLVQLIPAAAAEEQGGRFAFAAMTNTAVVIQPTYISYGPGQTVMEALQASRYSFEGAAGGFINVIEGVEAGYSRYANDGSYVMDRPASEITGFVFVGGSVELHDGTAGVFCDMVAAMADFNADDTGVKKYQPAQAAYTAAQSGLFSAGADHSNMAQTLRNAMQEYADTVVNGTRFPLTLAYQTISGAPLNEYTLHVTDSYGTEFLFTQVDTPMLRADEYAFDLSAGQFSARGEFCMEPDGTVTINGSTVSQLMIPDAQWIDNVSLHSESGGTDDVYPVDAETGAYLIADAATEKQIFLTAAQSTAAPEDARLYAVFTDIFGERYNKNRPWNSYMALLPNEAAAGPVGNTFTLEARSESAELGYTLVSAKTFEIRRTPTLRSLFVEANGVEQEIGFDPMIREYSFTVSADSVAVSAAAFDDAGIVCIDGEQTAEKTVSLTQAQTAINVSVQSAAGREVYTLNVKKVASVSVSVKSDADVTVEIFNTAGAQIGANADGTYSLVPGQSYSYVATKNSWYHTGETFTAAAGMTVFAKTPMTEDWLTDLQLTDTFSVTAQTNVYLQNFDKTQHAWTVVIADNKPTFYVKGTSAKTMQAVECAKTMTSGRATNVANFLSKDGTAKELTVRLSDGIYYQDYAIRINRMLSLKGLRMKVDGADEDLYQVQNGTASNVGTFAYNVPDYQAKIVRASQKAQLTVEPIAEDYYLLANGSRVDFPKNPETGAAAASADIRWDLNRAKDRECMQIQGCREDDGTVFRTYTVTLKKNDAVSTSFFVSDENGAAVREALVVVKNVRNGERIWPEADGSFPLVETMDYSYVATCYGHKGVSGTITAAADAARIELTLEKTAAGGIETDITSSWPYFRGSADANGVVNVRTPITAESAMLSWANKLGDGYSEGALGCPILITENGYDYLIVYAGTSIFKVDAISGTVVASGQMARGSSFAINSPTYAEGMIFVGLSNGGVQAFRADTLQSIWLYNDEKGGQPNCPIAYHDGYVYTGFWNSETTKANFVCLSVTDEDPTRTTEEKLPTWTHTDKGFYWAGCYVTDDYLLVGTDDGDSSYTKESASLLCLDPATGAVLDSVQGLRGDVRSNVSYDSATDRFYFTSKGGYFYSVKMDTSDETPKITDLRRIYLYNYANDPENPPMSTCTPVIYNGRAYIGVSGTGQFEQYSGHNITVIDLSTWAIAYSVRTQGYPQTSGLLTTAYQDDGSVYVYFFDNFTPGKLRALHDRPGQTAPDLFTVEEYTDKGNTAQYTTPYVLFTPSGGEAQYAICSPITDTHSGTLYFKNDSARLMALSSTIEKMEVTKQPDKLEYQQGEQFDPTGMEIQITYTNGTTRTLPARRTVNGITIDYFTWSDEPLSSEMPDLMIGFRPVLYQNYDGEVGVPYMSPQAVVQLTITSGDAKPGDLNADGEVDMQDLSMMIWYVNEVENFTLNQGQLTAADVDGSGEVDLTDVSYMIWYLNEVITEFPVTE
ncbi:MAG: dockerin type I domain-containing protein [Clostridia bacterium]|nr:dockerin type I domain-containing protein [Clostridia bacterium]